MKTLKTFFFILLAAITVTSCSSGDDNPNVITYPEENPLNAYLTASGFNQKEEEVKNYENFEFGFSFRPAVTGKINAFMVKIPDVNTALRVTLWDVATKSPIKSEIINVTEANVMIEEAITPIVLTKGKEYYITFNTNDYFVRTKTDNTAITYPISAGNITITGHSYIQSSDLQILFPTNTDNRHYYGDVTFKFQQTE